LLEASHKSLAVSARDLATVAREMKKLPSRLRIDWGVRKAFLGLAGLGRAQSVAHFPKPFFRAKKNRWYVQLDGKHVNLGPDEGEAYRLYHTIMAKRGEAKPEVAPPPKPPEADTVVAVLELFLDWCQNHRELLTYQWYLERTQAFARFLVTDP